MSARVLIERSCDVCSVVERQTATDDNAPTDTPLPTGWGNVDGSGVLCGGYMELCPGCVVALSEAIAELQRSMRAAREKDAF